MPSIREAYFDALSLNIPKSIVNFALQEVNNFDYTELTQHFDDEIKDYNLFKTAIERYLNGEMIEYIFNRAYFLKMPLYVNKDVLIPRQETEDLVMIAKDIISTLFEDDDKLSIADVCAGSGAIGLSMAKHYKNSQVYLSDYSNKAIDVIKKNANDLDLNVSVLYGDMLKPFIENNIKLDVIICNPPYIENIETIDKRTWEQEPHMALLASPCTKYYEELLKDVSKVINKVHLIAFEIGEDMQEVLEPLVKKYCPNDTYTFEKDLDDRMRYLFIANAI